MYRMVLKIKLNRQESYENNSKLDSLTQMIKAIVCFYELYFYTDQSDSIAKFEAAYNRPC